MLFNLKDDSYKPYNLAENRRDICKDAVYYLNEWHDEVMFTMDFNVDAWWTVTRKGI